MLRRRRRAHGQCQPAKPIPERVNAHSGAQTLPDRATVVGSGTSQYHNELSVAPAHMVVRSQRMPNDLGHGREARFGGGSGACRVVWRIDFGDENRDRAFRGSRRDRRFGSNDELVR